MGIVISQDEIAAAALVLVVREDDGYLWGANGTKSAAVRTLRRIASEIEDTGVKAGLIEKDGPGT